MCQLSEQPELSYTCSTLQKEELVCLLCSKTQLLESPEFSGSQQFFCL
jgi:hypothetical protein